MRRAGLTGRLLATTAFAGFSPAAFAVDAEMFAVTARAPSGELHLISDGLPIRQDRAPGPTVIASLGDAGDEAAQTTLAALAQAFEPDESVMPADPDFPEDLEFPSDPDFIEGFEPRDNDRPERKPDPVTPSRASEPEPYDVEDQTEVLFEADTVTRDTETSPIIAEGGVLAYFGKRYLRADKLSYDPQTDIVIAEGNVSITDDNLETAFAGRVELTGDLRDGIAENFSALLQENARLAADSAVREQGARTRLNNAIYTACNVCARDGDPKTPTWRIKSLRVTRDEERKVVRFHHAFFEIKGVPVFYSPFLQAPDPSVERQSGFLTPVIGASSRLGFNLEMPYYFAVSNHQDATFSPKYTSNDGFLWQGEYRRRDDSGAHIIQAGVIDFNNMQPDENGKIPVDTPGVRWHVFAAGHRDFGEKWSAGYDVERVSDDTYLRRYDIKRRGDLRKELDTARTNRLRSNAFVKWEDDESEFTADSYLFQGLRAKDDSSLTPYVLPLLNFRQDINGEIAGGRAYVNANFASLQRTGGTDSQRFTANAYWEREYITRGGHRFNAFAEVRGDGYYYHDLDEGTEILPGIAGADNQAEGRFAPTAGIEWSYPLTKYFRGGRLFLEPRVQLVASPSGLNPNTIINEDSQAVEFDYAGLFDYNKATGYDAFEDGQRLNAGVTASAYFDNGIYVDASIGQQYRLQASDAFDASSGVGEQRSDLVGSLDVRYKNRIGVENRFRIDDDTGSIQRTESSAFFRFWRFRANVTYVRLNEENSRAALVRREEVNGRLRVKLSRRWSAGFNQREDLLSGRTILQDFIIGYADECAALTVTYRRDFTQDVGLARDNALLIQFTLNSLVE